VGIFLDFGVYIFLTKLSGRQIGLLKFYFMSYLPHFFKEFVEILISETPPRAVEHLGSAKFGTVKAKLFFPPQFLHFLSFWIKFGVGGVHKNIE